MNLEQFGYSALAIISLIVIIAIFLYETNRGFELLRIRFQENLKRIFKEAIREEKRSKKK